VTSSTRTGLRTLVVTGSYLNLTGRYTRRRLDPYEREEWDEATESISDQFKHIWRSAATKRILRQVPVPFTELEDLGDFIRAHEAASMVFDDEEIPDEWSNLQATIHSRT